MSAFHGVVQWVLRYGDEAAFRRVAENLYPKHIYDELPYDEGIDRRTWSLIILDMAFSSSDLLLDFCLFIKLSKCGKELSKCKLKSMSKVAQQNCILRMYPTDFPVASVAASAGTISRYNILTSK